MIDIGPEELAEINYLIGDVETERSVAAEELAKWIGLTPDRINALARDRAIPCHKNKTFPLQRAVLAYSEYAQQGAIGRHSDANLLAQKLRLARANAEKVVAANARARGELAPLAEVEREWARITTH